MDKPVSERQTLLGLMNQELKILIGISHEMLQE